MRNEALAGEAKRKGGGKATGTEGKRRYAICPLSIAGRSHPGRDPRPRAAPRFAQDPVAPAAGSAEATRRRERLHGKRYAPSRRRPHGPDLAWRRDHLQHSVSEFAR